MKPLKNITFLLILVLVIGCNDDFMERYPLSQLSPENSFTSETELQAYTNGFYNTFPAALDVFYHNPLQADDDARTTVPDELRGSRTVPTTGGGWNWSELRRINFFLDNSHKFQNEQIRAKYDALARFFRAYFYYEKVQRFGDVPWYNTVIEMDDEENLIRARDSRAFVMERIAEDLDYAIEHLDQGKSVYRVTKWTALALKSRAFLFEGTFRKYHGIPGWEEMLDYSIAASDELISSGGYGIYTSSPESAYHELFVSKDADPTEMILARQYDASVPFVHSVNFYTLSVSYGRPGVLRQVVNSYLNADGSRFTDNPEYETMQWFEETQNRDPRLSQTIRTPGYTRIGENAVSLPDFAASITGYQYTKFLLAPSYDQGNCDNDMPIFRYAEILLNYAEAKAERGNINQSDIDRSIKLLRDRVGMPNLDMNIANANPDPFLEDQYVNVTGSNKGLILEIRRERRVELIREGHRWYDLLRWKEGSLLTREFHGMYFPGVGTYDIDRDGTIDLHIYEGERPASVPGRQYISIGEVVFENGAEGGQIVVNPSVTKEWDETRDYLYPIPTQERLLNRNLNQNPGWVDGI